MSTNIAKAGWLYRLSSVLKRWKKNWFVLDTNGDLRYFESLDSHQAEEVLIVPTECIAILTGANCTDGVKLPVGTGQSCRLTIITTSGKWHLCGESPDDVRAWEISLEEGRVLRPAAVPPLAYGPPPAYGSPPAYCVQPDAIHVPHSGPTIITNGASPYPRQQMAYGYPGQSYYGSHPPQYVVQGPPGGTTVIYDNRRRYDDGDLGMGLVAGAAIGSMLYAPLLFW